MHPSHDSGVTRYVATVHGYTPLSREDEQQLVRRWRDDRDERARDSLVRSSLRLVVAIAKKHARYGIPLGELIAEGNFGIVRALGNFDPERGTRFTTYAGHWVRACVLQHVLRSWSIVGSGMPRSKLFFKLRRERVKLTNLVGEGEHADALLAERLDLPQAKVRSLLRRVDQRDFSLDSEGPAGDGSSLLNALVAPELNQEQRAMASESGGNARDAMRDALTVLDDRERLIVESRLLVDSDAEVISLAELGRKLGVSRERVRQLEERAKRKIKARISARSDSADWIDLHSAA